MINFRSKLSLERQREYAKVDDYFANRLLEVRNLTNENLARTAEFYMQQMKAPWKYEPSAPVYDSVFWHVIIPEMMRRIKANTEALHE